MTTRNQLLIIIGVLAIILLGLAVYTFAILLPGNSSLATASITPTPVTTPTVDSSTKANKPRRYTGTIESIGNQTLTILRGKKTITVNVDGSTTYSTPTGASFSGLKVGQSVVVKGQPDAQAATVIMASSITVTTQKAKATPTP